MQINKSQLVELKIFGIAGGNTGTNFQFQDQPYLRNKPIFGLETFLLPEVPVSPTDAAVVTEAQLIKGFLTLYTQDLNNPASLGEFFQNVPLIILHRVQNTSNNAFVRVPFELKGQTIIWDKSYIRLTSPLNNTVDTSFLLNVYFK